MNGHEKQEFLVLVADDSENDRILLKRALRHTTRLRLIFEVTNGAEAIAYLQGHAVFADREKFPLPDLLLLDLNMPVKDGFEVLEWLGKQPWPNLKVVVLTDSMHPEHIKRALDLGADHFQVKPSARGDLDSLVLALEEHLLNAARPAHPRPAERMA
jgi:CheY-like chemotaxis protein